MFFVILAGTMVALLLLAYGGRRAIRALEAIQAGVEGVHAGLAEPQGEATQGELSARLTGQDAKIDRLTILWVDFLDKYERAASRIEGARGGKPSHRRSRRDEEEGDDPDNGDDAAARAGQRMLALPSPVESVPGPRQLVFAPLPPFKMK